MKVIMKPIEMIALFSPEGDPTPIKFKMIDGRETVTVKVDNLIDKSRERLAGNHMLVFLCESTIEDTTRRYELKYELSTCK